MRYIFTFLFICSLVFNANSQTVQKEYKVVQVMSPQTFYLNGGNRAAFGGKSRTWLPITLPVNTVEWYYSFSTSGNKNSDVSLKLVPQLTRLLDPSGFTAITASLLLTPTGAGVCDSYLMDRKNADAFLEKVDNWGGTFYYKPTGSRANYKNGTIQIKDIRTGNWCLGFKNPSATEGISITIEVAAIVQETKIIAKTETEEKAEMLGNLGWKAYEKGDYDKCLELSTKALEINSELGWVNANIGLVQLIKNDYLTAIDSYSKAITLFKKTSNPKWYFGETIKDLNNLIFTKGNVEGSTEIRELLQNEYNKY